ncbi:CP2 transcription factor [Verticillium dahliae]
MNPNSFSFNNFANYPATTPYSTTTMVTCTHRRWAWPLSMPTSEGATIQPGQAMMDMSGFQDLHPHQFHYFNSFIQAPPPQPSCASSSFVHQDTLCETMGQDGSPIDLDPSEERHTSIDNALHGPSPMVGFKQRQYGGMQVAAPLPSSAEEFRFHATLHTPTTMIKHADEIPVTYLNKGQAYSMSIVDTNASLPVAPGTKYRTFVRISFEDEEQRKNPDGCWSLWKEGRGTNEAHQRDGKLQAVEYVEAKEMPREGDNRTQIELESSSFDGFSVLWTPGINGGAECNMAVRFNFLSTDFSHSKGVKGIPLRFCAKTSTFPIDTSQPAADANPEICYCEIKLFRDHGAERKLSNDVARVKKSIDKLKQQIAQAESGLEGFSKRKRTAASETKIPVGEQRPGKVQKHKRAWSMSSASSAGAGNGGDRPPIEEELHLQLQTLQNMFSSARPFSTLYLRGDDLDDPDAHPVSLAGGSADLAKVEFRDSAQWQARSNRSSIAGSSLVSPSPSSLSLVSQASAVPGWQWTQFDGDHSGDPLSRQGSDQLTKVANADEAGNLNGWIEALGVDYSYLPPPERVAKPVACFYVRKNPSSPDQRELHKAVYLAQRTLMDFKQRLALKWNIHPSQVLRTIHILQHGLEVEMDDDVIQGLREGQDMALDVVEIAPGEGVQTKREWKMAVDSTEGEESAAETQVGYEFRLTF